MRPAERQNLAKVHIPLKKRGMEDTAKLGSYEAIQTFAKQGGKERGGHCMQLPPGTP